MNKEQFTTKIRNNKAIRCLIYPFYNIYMVYLLRCYEKSEDSQYVQEKYRKYAGKRCFVIGNGPSLIPADLEKTRNEITFASNRIYNIFDQTDWRPTFYLSLDVNAMPFMITNIRGIGNFPKFINYRAKKLGRQPEDNIHYLFCHGHFRINPYQPQATALYDDASKYITKVSTVTVNAIELAMYMGFSEIYLLGVDNNYAKKIDKNGKIYDDPTVKSSYFVGMKDSQGKLGDGVSAQNVEAMNYSYQLAKKFADEHGVKIYNATRGGKLEVFPRVDFDSLFPPQNT